MGVHPTSDDPVVRSLSEGIGGPIGTRAGRHPWWTPTRVILGLMALMFALGMLQKAPCYLDSWQDSDARYTHMCYSDLPYLYTGRGLVELNWPYSTNEQVRKRYPDVMEYPVVISYWAWGTAWITYWVKGSPDFGERYRWPPGELFGRPDIASEMRGFVIINALGFAVLVLLAAWFLTQVNPHRPWDAAGFALAPSLVLSGLINWDILAVTMVAGALFTWARGRPVWTGVLIGLGTATKLYPLFLLGGLLVICWRNGAWRQFGQATAASVVTWLMVNAPAYLTGPAQWRHFWAFNDGRGADLGSIWLVLSQAFGLNFTPQFINRVSLAFFIMWCFAVLVVGLSARRTPRLAQLGLLIVIGFLLINKVYSPQYVLWILPLAVIARPRWRDLLIWQAGEVLYFASVWWYLGGYLERPGDSASPTYWLAIVLRIAAELYLVFVVTRDIIKPDLPQAETMHMSRSERKNADFEYATMQLHRRGQVG